MRLHRSQHTFQNNWETVTSAFWEKYPNHRQPHVRRVDTIGCGIDAENGRLNIRRLVSLRYAIPSWIEKAMRSTAIGFGVEDTECRLEEKRLTLTSENVTFSNWFKVKEVCEYTVHPDNPEWTLFTQEARYTVMGFGIVSPTLEKLAIQMAQDKASIGLKAMSDKIITLEAEWKRTCDTVKQQASQLYTKKILAFNNMLHLAGEVVQNELDAAIHQFTIAKNRMLICEEMCKKYTDGSTKKRYENAKHVYAEALSTMESRVLQCYDTAKRCLKISSNNEGGLYGGLLKEVRLNNMRNIFDWKTRLAFADNMSLRISLPHWWSVRTAIGTFSVEKCDDSRGI